MFVLPLKEGPVFKVTVASGLDQCRWSQLNCDKHEEDVKQQTPEYKTVYFLYIFIDSVRNHQLNTKTRDT